MISIESAFSVASAGLAFGGMILAFFWKGDEAISAEFREWLSRTLKGLKAPQLEYRLPHAFNAIFDRTFGTDPLSLCFVSRSVILSMIAIGIFSATYIIIHPAFWGSIVETHSSADKS